MSQELLVLIAGSATLALLVLAALVLSDRRRRAHRARVARALSGHRPDTIPTATKPRQRRSRAARPGDPVGRNLARLDEALARAGMTVSAGEVLTQIGIAVLALYAIFVLLLQLPLVQAVAMAVAGPAALLLLVLRFKRARRIAAFTAGLPDALDVFARGLKAGRPVADSLSIVVENAPDPVRGELARCRDQIKMGTTLADAFADLAARMPTAEAHFFGVATALQSETGGNLIETIENLSAQLRERRKLKQKARALSSEARASAIILASLPFAVGLVIFLLNAAYLDPLFSDPRGRAMLITGICSIALGIFMMVRMGKLDV